LLEGVNFPDDGIEVKNMANMIIIQVKINQSTSEHKQRTVTKIKLEQE